MGSLTNLSSPFAPSESDECGLSSLSERSTARELDYAESYSGTVHDVDGYLSGGEVEESSGGSRRLGSIPETARPSFVKPAAATSEELSAHSRVQQRLGLKLDTRSAMPDQVESDASLEGCEDGVGNEAVIETPGREEEIQTGWVTLVKNGKKLVSSRLRLDPYRRHQFEDQWTRRLKTDKLCDTDDSNDGERKTEAAKAAAAILKSARMTHNFAMELSAAERTADPAAFAFGGIHPGTLHAHGKLFETHKASYSIGVAGQYLLHVRLRKQALSLPGSPFLLTIKPGRAFALSTKLPKEITGEVGGLCSMRIVTGDKMGNPCVEGGGRIVVNCHDAGMNAEVDDLGDGSYEITLTSTKTGTFEVGVKIDDVHTQNSPMKVKLTSSNPELAQSFVYGDGIKQVVKGDAGVFWIAFRDHYGNPTIQTSEFRESFECGMCLVAPGMGSSLKSRHDAESAWVDEGFEPGYAQYRMSFVPTISGACSMYVWWESHSAPGSRDNFPESPFNLSVLSNSSDYVVSSEVVDTSGVTPGDYKIALPIFQAAQQRWGTCTVDAFASAATSMLPRFWTRRSVSGAEATNAFKQTWKASERVWAHPPGGRNQLLFQLAVFMESRKRKAESIICVPYRPTCEWFYRLNKLADDRLKYLAGKLQRVAEDAPDRLEAWPIMIFRIPAAVEDAPGEEEEEEDEVAEDSQSGSDDEQG